MAHFFHGDFGYHYNETSDDIEWDGEGGVEPTEADYEAAGDHWDADGAEEYAREYAEELGDYLLQRRREADY